MMYRESTWQVTNNPTNCQVGTFIGKEKLKRFEDEGGNGASDVVRVGPHLVAKKSHNTPRIQQR